MYLDGGASWLSWMPCRQVYSCRCGMSSPVVVVAVVTVAYSCSRVCSEGGI